MDRPELIDLMNDIYMNYWCPLQNFFLPTFKLKEKLRIGSKIKKKYDEPKTPYKRVIESGVLKNHEIEALQIRKAQLNPFELKRGLKMQFKDFLKWYEKKTLGRQPNMNKITRSVLVSSIYGSIRSVLVSSIYGSIRKPFLLKI